MEYVATSDICDGILSDYGIGSTIAEAIGAYLTEDTNLEDLNYVETPGESYLLKVYELIDPNHDDWDEQHARDHDYEWYTGKLVATAQVYIKGDA